MRESTTRCACGSDRRWRARSHWSHEPQRRYVGPEGKLLYIGTEGPAANEDTLNDVSGHIDCVGRHSDNRRRSLVVPVCAVPVDQHLLDAGTGRNLYLDISRLGRGQADTCAEYLRPIGERGRRRSENLGPVRESRRAADNYARHDHAKDQGR